MQIYLFPNVVNVMTVRDSIPGRSKTLVFTTLYSVGISGSFLVGKAAGMWSWSPISI